MSAATAREMLLRALVSRLTTGLGAAVTGIYTQVPQSETPESDDAFPYIVIMLSLNELGTDTEDGFDGLITLWTFTRTLGDLQAAQVEALVYDLLHRQEATLDVTGFGVSSIMSEESNVQTLDDGITRQSPQNFRIYFEPVEG
jgi:hypothetical protein